MMSVRWRSGLARCRAPRSVVRPTSASSRDSGAATSAAAIGAPEPSAWAVKTSGQLAKTASAARRPISGMPLAHAPSVSTA